MHRQQRKTNMIIPGQELKMADLCLRHVNNVIDTNESDIVKRSYDLGSIFTPTKSENFNLLIHVYDKIASLIYAEINGETVVVEPGDELYIDKVKDTKICRGVFDWFSVDVIDEIMSIEYHVYCGRKIRGGIPYCKEHINQFQAKLMEALLYGRKLNKKDLILAGTHIVYFVYPYNKIGVTRRRRFLKRAAEQLHLLFIPIAECNANLAIEIEKNIVKYNKLGIKNKVELNEKTDESTLVNIRNNPYHFNYMNLLRTLMFINNWLNRFYKVNHNDVTILLDKNPIDAYTIRMDVDLIIKGTYKRVEELEGTFTFLDFVGGFLVFQRREDVIFTPWVDIVDKEIIGGLKS